ncbi:hypothetical protein KJ365_05965 [Glaciecola sp. XM2]|jgi:hypothetical protein|nr:hypothetical protein [Glaciecola sp. XM2]
MILKQNIPYAALIYSALDLCEVMLTRSQTLYPFAVMSIENDIQSVFPLDMDDQAQGGMIENLQLQLAERRMYTENTISLLVYAATVSTPMGEHSDAIIFNITDSNGENTVTLYPYFHEQECIKLGAPFTCDFSD